MIQILHFTMMLFILSYTSSFSQYSGLPDYTVNKDWKLKTEKKGIKVYTFLPEGEKLKELLLQFEVNSTMEDLLDVVEDIPAHSNWVFKCNNSFVIDEISEQEVIYYIDSDFPIPMKDRALIVHYKRFDPDEQGVIKTYSKVIDHEYDIEEDMVIIEEFESTYTLTPISNGVIDVNYFMRVNPGSNIPAWLINFASSKGPIKTIINLKNLLEGK